ncbi:MAG: YeeE/YedE family protein [Phycisphaerales bacterium]|nr:YeeE/YedE family protein [Phycisphaerales bacterium]
MKGILGMPRWSPYAVGVGIGVLSWITFGLMGRALGTSTTFVNAAGAIEGLVAPAHVESNEYLARHIVSTAEKARPIVGWQFALVVMLAVGAFAAARLAGSTFREHIPSLWLWRFGGSRPLRYCGAILGGALLLFGARLADGCTSGHGISGGLQLAVSSWVFLGAMFGTGVAAAFLMYGREGRSHV